VRIQYRQGEDGWIIAECPDLPGCVSQGRTLPEARKNIADAVDGWLKVHRDLGLTAPVFELIEVS
jgi:predicted RNase H-like HicB family nuclease